jgi:hypothetical protein
VKFSYKHASLVIGAGLAGLLVLPTPGFALATLGSAAGYAVLAGSAITSTGVTTVQGDVGLSPGISITGMPAGQPNPGVIHTADPAAALAKLDLGVMYGSLASAVCGTRLTGVNLGAHTLTPGVYCFAAAAGLTGVVTLDAQGDPNAVFVFQMGSTLTVASGASVALVNGAQASNVWWQVGSSATLGIGSTTVGTIIASASITLTTNAVVLGRVLARTGAVTLDKNNIGAGGGTTPTNKSTWGAVKSIYR